MSVFNKGKSKAEKFANVTKGSSEGDKRDAEKKLLKPEIIPTYTGSEPAHKSELHSRTALIVFRNKAQQDLIGNLFSIRTSMQGTTYITDISLLELIAQKVHDGEMVVNGDNIDVFNASDIPPEINFDPVNVGEEAGKALRERADSMLVKTLIIPKKKKGKKKKKNKKEKSNG